MKTLILILKIIAITLLSSVALLTIGELLGIIDFSLITYVVHLIADIDIDLSMLFDYLNFWLVASYFIFKAVVLFGINLLKKGKK